MNNVIYKQLNIWKKVSNKQLICYRLFERLSDNSYAVQSVDYFSIPIDEKIFMQFNKQLIELFLETNIEEREKFYSSIEEAIKAFDNDFT